ncbi:MAG: 30S ribosomal protein S6 [Candidatus Gracilibacteria bacterium]|jgi:small subunit ribosomal protein S6
MRKYELMLILNPELGDAGAATLLGEIKAELETIGTTIEKEDIMGVKDLAYKINNSKTGYYALYTLGLEKGDFFAVTNAFNLKKDIWRNMFVRLEETK